MLAIKLQEFIHNISIGDFKTIARALTLVENNILPSEELLKSLNYHSSTPVIGITGPPGAGKSTLVNAIVSSLTSDGRKVAVLAVDPTSPFNLGSLLGDRIRMVKNFNNPNLFIRSLATRGSLGGVSEKTLEMIDVLRAANFDLIIVETVGVGQSEIEIAGLADKTILVLVPEAGDEIQHIKSGLMEVANAFVVNKADREGADHFANSLTKMVREQHQKIPVFKTVAEKNEGINDLIKWIEKPLEQNSDRKNILITQKALKIIQQQKMASIKTDVLYNAIVNMAKKPHFNVYRFVEEWLKAHN
ncbi:methylmalonyl Co-A mutase-associated GTPase MeaB [Pedobacter sp.]|uniref:methylmalonyl Co-A mutase-associated GTPase MeaB n=1 Tax=Pedobacter sp. TaxID=1411316 RepID=UPI00396CABCC